MTDNIPSGIRVFVYGSLKKDHGNHSVLEGATFVGRSTLKGNYTMVDLSYYPGLVASGEDTTIAGEVWLVDQDGLNALDLLEGHPSYYKREKRDCELGCKVWVYLLPDSYLENREVVATGIWRPLVEELEWFTKQGVEQCVSS